MIVRSLGDHVATIHSLHAYVDDELAPGDRRKVEALLANRPDASARVGDYLQQNRYIREHNDARAQGPLAPAIEAEVSRLETMLEGRSRRARIRSMAAPALMAAGIAGLLWLGSDLLLDERLSPGSPGGTQLANAGGAPSAGAAFPVPDLGRFGFRLVASRAVGGGPADHRHLIYRDQAGAQVSLYLSDTPGRVDSAADERNTFLRQGPFSYLFWNHGRRQFGMIGEVDQDVLLAMGQAVDDSGAPTGNDTALVPAERSAAEPAAAGAAAASPQGQQGDERAGRPLPTDPAPAQTEADPALQPAEQPADQPADAKPKDAASAAPQRSDTA